MGIQDKLNIAIKFDLPVLPFFSLQDITDYASEGISLSNVKGNFTISNPLGTVYSNSSWVTPDLNLSVSPTFNSVNIPLNNGVPLSGIYTFQYTIKVSGGVESGIYTKTFTIDYTYVSPKVSIVLENNPYVALLSSRDTTQYMIDGVVPTQTRTMTLVFPDLSNVPTITTPLFYISVTSPFYLSGLYQTTVNTDLVYQFLTYAVHDVVNGGNQILVEDTVNIENIYFCLKSLNNEIVNNPNNADALAKFNRATGLLELLEQAISFGQYNDADSYIQQIYEVTGCSNICGKNGAAQSIQPYWINGSGGGVTSFNTRVGVVTLLSTDVVAALGYTPAHAANCVPYIGAINNLDMGSYSIKTPNIYVNDLSITQGTSPYSGSNIIISDDNLTNIIGQFVIVHGIDSGQDLTTGSYNSIFGNLSGNGLITGNYNTIIGSQISGLTSNLSNNVILSDGQGNIVFQDDATHTTLPRLSGTGTRIVTADSTGKLGSITNSFITLTSLSSTATGLTYTNTTGVFSLTSGYVIPTTTEETNWNTAYSNRIATFTTTGTSGAATFSGNTLNIPQYQAGLNGTGFVKISGTTISYDNSTYLTLTSLSSTATGLTYTNTTGVFSLTSGYVIPTTTEETNWNTAYTDRISSVTSPLSFTSNILSMTQSNSSTNGWLSSTDWSAFAAKQSALSGFGFVKISGSTISYDNSTYYPASNPNNYISTISGIVAGGELSGTYANPTLLNSAVTGKVLTGLNVGSGGTILATDSILIAFGKIQNVISSLLGGVQYQGTWNASTNIPTIPTAGPSNKGWYYVVNVAGSTSEGGITDWKVGDWIISDGINWNKVDNTDAVSSVNGYVGAVNLTTADILEVTNLYYTDVRARLSISSTATGLTYTNTTGVFSLTSGYVIPTTTEETNWNTAYTQTRQWDGGATGLVAATGRTSLGLVIGTDVLAYRTFGTAANNNTGDFEVPLTFSTGLNRTGNTITNTITQYTDAMAVSAVSSAGYFLTANFTSYFNTALATKTTNNLTEGSTNLYYTDVRVSANTDVAANTAARHSALTLGTSHYGLSLSSQVLSMQLATTSLDGALLHTDWNTFNGKQNALSGTGLVYSTAGTISYDTNTYLTTSAAASTYLALSGGTVAGVTTFNSHINVAEYIFLDSKFYFIRGSSYSGGLTANDLVISNNTSTGKVLFANNSGYWLQASNLGAATFASSVTATSFITSGGTSSQFVKGDGSLDSTTYLTTSTAASTYLPLSGGVIYSTLHGDPANSGTSLATTTLRIRGNDNGVLDIGEYSSHAGSYWFQVHDKTDQSINYDLYLQPNGGNTIVGGAATFTSNVFTLGNVSINSTSAAAETLDVFGTMRVRGAATLGYTSATQQVVITHDGTNAQYFTSGNTVKKGYQWYIDGGVVVGMSMDTSSNLTVGGEIDTNSNFGFKGTSGSHYIYFPDTGSHTGSMNLQAGYGSAAAGGTLILYGAGASGNAGGAEIGLSTSGASFNVRDGGNGTGSYVFSVARTGAITGTNWSVTSAGVATFTSTVQATTLGLMGASPLANAAINMTATTSAQRLLHIGSNGADTYIGTASSSGGSLVTGSDGYSLEFRNDIGFDFGIGSASTLKLGYNATFSGTVTATSFITSGGTSSQFTKGDGSLDSSTYLTTSSAASTYLPLSGGTLSGNLYGTSALFSGGITSGGNGDFSSGQLYTTNYGHNPNGNYTYDSISINKSTSNAYGIGIATPVSGRYNMWFRTGYGNGGGYDFYSGSTLTATIDISGYITASGYKIAGGTGSFLKDDGSIDSSTYLTTSSAASTYLPLSGGTVTGVTTFNSHVNLAEYLFLDSKFYFIRGSSYSGGLTANDLVISNETSTGKVLFANNSGYWLQASNLGAATFASSVTATTFYGNLAWSYLTSTPTTLAGYGIPLADYYGNYKITGTQVGGYSGLEFASAANSPTLMFGGNSFGLYYQTGTNGWGFSYDRSLARLLLTDIGGTDYRVWADNYHPTDLATYGVSSSDTLFDGRYINVSPVSAQSANVWVNGIIETDADRGFRSTNGGSTWQFGGNPGSGSFFITNSGVVSALIIASTGAATFASTVTATNYYATSLTNHYLPYVTSGGLFADSTIYQSSGNIGVGTTTLIEKFNINGYAYATGYKTPSGTSAGFLKADGSIDTTAYSTVGGISAYGSWSISGGPVTVTSGVTQQVNFDTANVTQVGTITHSGGSFLLSIGYWEINATIYCNNSLVGTTAIMYIMNLDTNTVLYVTECTVDAGGGFGVCTLSEIVEPSSNIHYGIVMDCALSTTTFDIRDVIGGNICSTLTLKKIG